MECKLKRIMDLRLQNIAWQTAIKKLTDLLPINICCIGAVGFYQNLAQPDTIAFTTSLYEIDRLIEEKEAIAQDQLNRKEQELMDEELVD